jgi:hypothetical protein
MKLSDLHSVVDSEHHFCTAKTPEGRNICRKNTFPTRRRNQEVVKRSNEFCVAMNDPNGSGGFQPPFLHDWKSHNPIVPIPARLQNVGFIFFEKGFSSFFHIKA